MRSYTVFTTLLICAAAILSSCQAPHATPFDRPPNSLKFHSGGYNPGTNPDKHKH